MALDRNANPYNLDAAPHDQELKWQLRSKLLELPEKALVRRLEAQLAKRAGVVGDLAPEIAQRVLDTTGGTTGNVLPRVDLEQTIYALM